MRRRNIKSEEMGERVQVSLKLPKEILDRIDDAWKSGDVYTGRSHYIEEACKHYLDSVPCPKCGSLNSSAAKICSNCENKLEPYLDVLSNIVEELKIYDEIHQEIVRLKEEYDDLNSKLKWLVSKLSTDKEDVVNDITGIYSESINKSLNCVNSYLEYYNIYSSQVLPLTEPLDLIETKYEDLDTRSIYDLITFNENYYDVRSAVINYEYRFAKLVISDYSSISYSKLLELRVGLATERIGMKLALLDISNGLENLKSVEKMIDVLTRRIA